MYRALPSPEQLVASRVAAHSESCSGHSAAPSARLRASWRPMVLHHRPRTPRHLGQPTTGVPDRRCAPLARAPRCIASGTRGLPSAAWRNAEIAVAMNAW